MPAARVAVVVGLGALCLSGCVPFAPPTPAQVDRCASLHGGTELVLQGAQAITNSEYGAIGRRFSGPTGGCAGISRLGGRDNQVKVTIPGVSTERAAGLARPGLISFRTWVKAPPGADGKLAIPLDATADPVVDPADVPKAEGGTCTGSISTECIPVGYLPKETGVDGSMVNSANVGSNNTANQPNVQFTLNDQGTTILGQVTADMPTRTPPDNELAIFLDNTMINNATVQAALNNGQVEISGGNVSSDDGYRQDLAAILSSGPLPRLTVVSTRDLG